MFGLTHDQIENIMNVNYCRLLKKTGMRSLETSASSKLIPNFYPKLLETRKLTYNAAIGTQPVPSQPKEEANNNKRKNENSAQSGKSKKSKK